MKGLPMGRSFYYGTDSELYHSSKVFTAKILAAPADYGLSLELCQEYAALDAAYQASYVAAADPSSRTRGSIYARRNSRAALMTMASNLVRIIKGTASVTNEEKINLGISVPRDRAPIGAPGEPSNFSFMLDAIGALHLKWKCKNPRGAIGTMYQIYRRLNNTGGFAFLGVAGSRKFIDETVPPGTAAIIYRIQGLRGRKVGRSADFNVNFGAGRSQSQIIASRNAHLAA